jgi:hypothetical protein
VRVSTPWAGNGFGFIQVPRIGQEVIVDFLEGDPDQPIVTGRVGTAAPGAASAASAAGSAPARPQRPHWLGPLPLHAPARPVLDPHIDDAPALRDAVVRTLRLNDGLALMSAGLPTDEQEIAATVHASLVDSAWPVRPTEAALIPNDGGGARLIERLHPLDLIAQQHC